jgi:nucleotide-binding universal stress UspA family protein
MIVKNILVPTDFSAGSKEAVRYAFDLATALGATLHVLHVLENPFAPGAFMEMYTPPSPEYFVDMERQAEEKLRAALTADEKARVHAVMTTRLGVPASEILDRLHEDPPVDLVVMATHGRGGVARFVMGSVTDKIIRGAPCPVVTIREHPLAARPTPIEHSAGASA